MSYGASFNFRSSLPKQPFAKYFPYSAHPAEWTISRASSQRDKRVLEHFGMHVDFLRTAKDGFFLHPSDEDLSLGTPA